MEPILPLFEERAMTHIVKGTRPSVLRLLALFGLVLFASVVPRGVWSQTPDSQSPPTSETKANPFSGFETHYLSNGLRVWFKRLPEAPNVSISIGVPYGWDSDPRRKEELAHLTEHILFSDHDGRTEEDIKEEIDAIGGRHNGFTTPDHTWYYVTVSKEHGGFALEWLSRVVSPHAMDADVVERNRVPVAVEINAQPREFLESVWALLNPSWLLPPDFWRREFRMRTRDARRYNRWASLQRITPEDVADFYDRYYVPEAMTLTVIGDLDRSEALEIAERSLGSLDKRPVPTRAMAIEDPDRRRATSFWGFGPNVRYTARHKLFDSDAEDDLMVLFIRDLLRRRLNQRLRYGEQKAVYGLQVTTTQRGPGGFLQIQGSIAENEYQFAQAIIQEEIAALREGTLPPAEFEADRTALVERLRGENSTAQALNFWVLRNFYDPSKHTDFPDLISFFAGVSQDEVARFAARTFAPEREVTTLVRVHPMSRGIFAILVLVFVWLTVRAVAWTVTRPVTMTGILYMARFRMPIPLLIGWMVGFGTVGLIVARVIVFGVQSLALAFLVPIYDYSTQLLFYGAMLATAVVLSILYLSLFPRKLIVFPDHLRIKFLAYRSRIIKPDDLLGISTRRVQQVWFKKDVFRCVPLAFGLAGPGIYLRPVKGRPYFFRTRDTSELIDVLGGWRGVSVLPAVKDPADFARDRSQEVEDTSDWISSMAPDLIPGDEEPAASVASERVLKFKKPAASLFKKSVASLFKKPAASIFKKPAASIAPDPIRKSEKPVASIAPDPIPEDEEPPVTLASIALDPPPTDEESPVTLASIALDPPPEDEKPPATLASLAPDPPPEDEEPEEEEPPVTLASLALDPAPEDEEPPASIASILLGPLLEDEGGEND